MEKTYTKSEIIDIIDGAIKDEMQRKNKYIELNGYKHKEILNRFDTAISTISSLISKF